MISVSSTYKTYLKYKVGKFKTKNTLVYFHFIFPFYTSNYKSSQLFYCFKNINCHGYLQQWKVCGFFHQDFHCYCEASSVNPRNSQSNRSPQKHQEQPGPCVLSYSLYSFLCLQASTTSFCPSVHTQHLPAGWTVPSGRPQS